MELKQFYSIVTVPSDFLLIVPYGIETRTTGFSYTTGTLLIVPYGIETIYNKITYSSSFLLIVPYGIETNVQQYRMQEKQPFNRTLWN